jgi:hypothetical protein
MSTSELSGSSKEACSRKGTRNLLGTGAELGGRSPRRLVHFSPMRVSTSSRWSLSWTRFCRNSSPFRPAHSVSGEMRSSQAVAFARVTSAIIRFRVNLALATALALRTALAVMVDLGVFARAMRKNRPCYVYSLDVVCMHPREARLGCVRARFSSRRGAARTFSSDPLWVISRARPLPKLGFLAPGFRHRRNNHLARAEIRCECAVSTQNGRSAHSHLPSIGDARD